jgi:hypothetical protein
MTVADGTISPVRCTPWCIDGTGHPEAEEPAAQFCYAAERRLDLTPGVEVLNAGSREQVIVQLYRDVYQADEGLLTGDTSLAPPHIEIYANALEALTLSVDEARALGELLIELTDLPQR